MALTLAITTPLHFPVPGETQFWLHLTATDWTIGTVRVDYTKYSVMELPVQQAKEQLETAVKLAQTEDGLKQLMKKSKSERPSIPVPPVLKRLYPNAETVEEMGARVGEGVNLMDHIRADHFLAMAKNLQTIPPQLIIPRRCGSQSFPMTVPKGNHRFRIVREFLGNPDPWDVITVTFVDSQGEVLGVHHAVKGEAQAPQKGGV